MRAYSQEVRQQVLRAVDEGIPRAEIIERFQVSRATIKRYLKQRRETGNVLSRPIPGRPPRKQAALLMGVPALLEAHQRRASASIAGGGKRSMVCRSAAARGAARSTCLAGCATRRSVLLRRCSKGRVVGRVPVHQANVGAHQAGAARTTPANSVAA